MMHFSLSSKRRAAWFLIIMLVAQLFAPYQSYALTGGPSQPEVQSFEPIGTSEMVDVSSGSFTYNIPLLEVGGYPLNLAYHSGITPDDEASVCGLGWNINPGVVNRNMRGLPDDFSGDLVEKEFNIKPNRTWGGSLGFKMELFGWSKNKKGGSSDRAFNLGANLGIFYNNYKGVGFEFGIMPGFSAGQKGSFNAGMGLTANSQSGISVTPNAGFSMKMKEVSNGADKGNINGGLSIGASVNSRQGLSALTLGSSLGISRKKSAEASNSRTLYSGSSTFSFATPSYTPQETMPFMNFSYSTSFSVGFEITGLHPGGSISGYYSEQKLARNKSRSPAAGFLYAHDWQDQEGALMDFNREKDGPFTKHTPHLPPVVFTNDIYGVTGQGIAGSYQLKRGDIGVLSDPLVQTLGAGGSTGFEIGFGAPPGVHGGGDIVVNVTNSHSGRWRRNNNTAPLLAFRRPGADPNYEPAYFKMAGEKSVETDPAFYTTNGGNEPARVHLEHNGVTDMQVKAANYLETEGNVVVPTKARRTVRERRNQSINYLTAQEAREFGLQKKIISHKMNLYGPTDTTETGRTEGFRKGHHLSEITVLRQDGLRYIYGIPAYNVSQEEVSFSVNSMGDCSTGLVSYNPTEASVNNNSGEDNYFNKVKTPAYAHSYLLTTIVSQDYVDLTGDGPTPDDFGTYTKFNYTRVYQNYDWRIPHRPGTANFNEGFKSTDIENKANYIAGQKEYWVLHSIESKTQVAEFSYNAQNRPDAQSANGQVLPRLDKITQYSLPDRRYNTATSPVPIKTVHFEYDNSLCPGLPYFPVNSTIGKLTLKKLWFTYGNSQKGKLSPYRFAYGQRLNGQVVNPRYNLKAYNRWGSYQENKGAAGTACYDDPANPNTKLNTSDYPYVPQDDAQADANAAAYNLTHITLPSGGLIAVEYEANRYAFTQDRRAMEMIDIIGAADNLPPVFNPNALPNTLYSSSTPFSRNNHLFFKLRKPITAPDTRQELWKQYLDGGFGDKSMGDGYLYFKFLVNVGQYSKPQYEYVPGYAQIKDYGVVPGNPNYGYVVLSDVPVGDVKLAASLANTLGINQAIMTNSIAKTTWQFTRLYLPKIAYGQNSVSTQQNDEDIIKGLAKSITKQAVQFALGFNNFMFLNNYGQSFVPGKSWLRLCSPEKDKIAGGARVKSIRISDEWNKLEPASGTGFAYGQDYDYTTVENGDTISSGVAAYEPMVGGDENPFRQPEFFKEKAILAPDNRFYQEQPFGESFFPAPQIVYSKVTVLNRSHAGVTRTATGWVVHEFYTSRDFPTKTDNTGVRAIPKKTNPIFKQLLLKHKDYMTASEGFVIELNDMHGKPKAQWVYDEGGTRLSGVEYKYKRSGDRLVNEGIPVIDNFGAMRNAIVGLESSMVSDSRETFSKTRTAGVQLNTDNFLAGVYPVLTVIPLPSYHVEETRFRSMTTTKVVQRYGLLEKTIAYDLGASVNTENLAWDAETGEVILTRTENEFHDPVYNLNIPAHWGYEGMRGAYQNIGAVFAGVTVSNGVYSNLAFQHFFTPGDELIEVNGTDKFWVKDVNRSTGAIYLIRENGVPANFNGTLKIIRSGRRNQQLNSIGSVACLKIPLNATGTAVDFSGKEILNAGAVEYSDRWQTWCLPNEVCISSQGNTVNPYRTNNRGVFRPLRNWAFLTNRKQTAAGVNIRTDGTFATFSPFWVLPPIQQRIAGYPVWQPKKSGWTWTSEVTRFNPSGNELENRDTLNRYSAELTGYANTQVVATANNARYRQIAFEGFEDFVFEGKFPKPPCLKRHFEFNSGGVFSIKQGVSHSGKYALELAASGKVSAGAAIKSSNCPTPLAAKPANAVFTLNDCDCVGEFAPDPGRYIFSAWVREDRPAYALNFTQAEVQLAIVTGTTQQIVPLKAEGPVVEGWQRISGEFVVPQNATGLSVTLVGATDAQTWFDDLRIHPFDARFKSYVYDDISLKFTYELDENNFFTKYEYDQQGMLERVKKETVNGVMMIQEARFEQQKN